MSSSSASGARLREASPVEAGEAERFEAIKAMLRQSPDASRPEQAALTAQLLVGGELAAARAEQRAQERAARDAQRAEQQSRQQADAKDAAERNVRLALLRDFERSPFKLADFCKLKGLAPEAVEPMLAQARKDAAAFAPPPAAPRHDDRGPGGRPQDRRDGPPRDGRGRDDRGGPRGNRPTDARGGPGGGPRSGPPGGERLPRKP